VGRKDRHEDDVFPRWYINRAFQHLIPADFDTSTIIRQRPPLSGNMSLSLFPALALFVSKAGSAGLVRVAADFMDANTLSSKRQVRTLLSHGACVGGFLGFWVSGFLRLWDYE